MKKLNFLFLLVVLQIILLGCSATLPDAFLGGATPPDDFLKRKVAIEDLSFHNYTQCPLNEYIKGMKPGKWKKVGDTLWIYQVKLTDNVTNEKLDIAVLFAKHPNKQDVVMFQRAVVNGKDAPIDMAFKLVLSEAEKVLPENSICKADQKAAIEAPPSAPAPTVAPAAQTPIVAPAAPVAATAPIVAPAEPAPAVASAMQKIKVIGNRDSKRYHLPGMKYYNAVKAHHLVIFDSEADAINAGYHKAPR